MTTAAAKPVTPSPLTVVAAMFSAVTMYRKAVHQLTAASEGVDGVERASWQVQSADEMVGWAMTDAQAVLADVGQTLPDAFVTAQRLNDQVNYAIVSSTVPGPQAGDHILAVLKTLKVWDVTAGKYDYEDGKPEENVKVAHVDLTLDEALALYKECASYPFCRITFGDVHFNLA